MASIVSAGVRPVFGVAGSIRQSVAVTGKTEAMRPVVLRSTLAFAVIGALMVTGCAAAQITTPIVVSPTATTRPPVTATASTTTTTMASPTTQRATTTAVAPTVTASTTVVTAEPTTTVLADGRLDALDVLQSITVVNEYSTGYKRSEFRHWVDTDGDGCDARDEVLIAESTGLAQVDPFGCAVVAGDWLSIYDGVVITDPAELDIDHMIPLKEAWESGAWEWSPDHRKAFANDLSDPRTLVAVTAGSNRSKGDRDPSNWLPTVEDRCRYVNDWVAVKARWGLSMDESEFGRIRNILTACTDRTMEPWSPPVG